MHTYIQLNMHIHIRVYVYTDIDIDICTNTCTYLRIPVAVIEDHSVSSLQVDAKATSPVSE